MDYPIIFSAAMVRALLDGRKTMTRRYAWTMQRIDIHGVHGGKPTPWQKVKPGDLLWVRETFWGCDFAETGYLPIVVYAERHHGKTYDHPGNVRIAAPRFGHIPSIHMPRSASRLTLVVTATKIERLQDINEKDARAEGVLYVPGHGEITLEELRADPGYSNFLCCRHGFEMLWNEQHGPDAWDANPEVVALTFTVHKANIDALGKGAA